MSIIVKRRFGIIGGIEAVAADLRAKLTEMSVLSGGGEPDIIASPSIFFEPDCAGVAREDMTARKIRTFDAIRDLEAHALDALLLPSFVGHTFLGELTPEIRLPVVDLMAALRAHVERQHPAVRRIGVLAPLFIRRRGLFERYFDAPRWQLIYQPGEAQGEARALDGEPEAGAGNGPEPTIEQIERDCCDLLAEGAEIILPASAEAALCAEILGQRGLPLIDAHRVYARYALDTVGQAVVRPFKIGVVGGVGPAATVDFYDKIVRNTPAKRDQEHIKVVVEQNPQIPDRTENLIGNGADPTLAIYATCKRLEANEASIIAIPCNTAHAFVARIQPHLSIPIVNMLCETAAYIRRHYPERRRIGLLATTGTVRSRVYHEVIERAGLDILLPDAAHQARVMNAIYGEKGVKAGFVDGESRDDLLAALAHLVACGAEVAVLGCTELPLILAQDDNFNIDGKRVVVLDPTEILARKCVTLAGKALFDKA